MTSVEEHKHLGLILDNKLSFVNHLNEKLAQARKGIGIIRYMSKYAPIETLDQIYKVFVRSHLDYCDIIYHIPPINLPGTHNNSLNYVMNQIESAQYQAALAVTGTWKGSNRDKLYDELGWESLSDRRWSRRLVQIYKMINGLTPNYLQALIPPKRTHLYGQRRDNDLHNVKCRTQYFANSFLPLRIDKTGNKFCHICAIKSHSWNEHFLIKHIIQSESTNF